METMSKSGTIAPLAIVSPRVESVTVTPRENPALHQDRGWEAEDVTTPEREEDDSEDGGVP